MISAEEAMRNTQEIIRQHKTKELQDIESGIEKQIKKGKFKYSYDGYISKVAKEELEKYGYEVYIGTQYNESWVEIKWEK